MDGKKRRGARPGQIKPPKIPSQNASPEVVASLVDAALPAGPEHYQRDLEAARQAFLLAGRGYEGRHPTGMYSAFWALAASAAKAQELLQQRGAEIADIWNPVVVAEKFPSIFIRVPAWALFAFQAGWSRATIGQPDKNGNKGNPLPVTEAFGLGSGGARTVATKHRNDLRNFQIATAIAVCLQQDSSISENVAVEDAASKFGVSKSVAFEAWRRHKDPARDVASKYAVGELSESRQPKNKK
jgi:hypothetical protein